ncbi:hypothetical protein BO71DRAFT_427549 [Aspergillus ellipticus CBS 707.79]|uniref:Uncharacterized protein n=1 Tax=Aspergillus ellipticus CBS 707.79 TaxID=1448320 RepID=A0A319DHZ1_9EURO|nr:hypothetical protein BO71DRAFT_427549 [Aspergillus ellipticus CBS 707.79]
MGIDQDRITLNLSPTPAQWRKNIHVCGDSTFGPQVADCRGRFDFTLLFEECFLSIVPSALVLLALPFRYRQLWRTRLPKVTKSSIYWAKLVLGQVFGIAQLSLLVVWFLPHCAANANVCRRGSAVLSDVHRSALSVASGTSVFHPSLIRTLLNISLSLSFLFDAVRVRSLWLASCTVLAAIYTASVALKGVWFCLESRSKRASFIDRTVQYGDEEVHGVYNGAFFWWVNPLFRLGFKSTLSGEDLPHLDQRMSVDRLPHGFARRWAFAVTNYVGNPHPDKSQGHGLIGAFALVFTLKALFNCLYEHYTFRLITQIRGAIVFIYHI